MFSTNVPVSGFLTVKDNQPTLKKDIEDLSLVDFPLSTKLLKRGMAVWNSATFGPVPN
jgi:hypothetical protein